MGYSLDLFLHQDQIHDEFICSICQDVMKEPIMSEGCGHIFCTTCINDWRSQPPASSGNSNTCPIDRDPIVGLRAPFRAYMNIYNGFKLKCWFKECEGVFELGEIEAHVKLCEFNPEAILPCNYSCGASIRMIDLPNHDCYEYLKQEVANKNLQIVQLKEEFEQKLVALTTKQQDLEHWRIMATRKDAEIAKLKEEIDHCKREHLTSLKSKDQQLDELKKQVVDTREAKRISDVRYQQQQNVVEGKDVEIMKLKNDLQANKFGGIFKMPVAGINPHTGKSYQPQNSEIQKLKEEISKCKKDHADTLRRKNEIIEALNKRVASNVPKQKTGPHVTYNSYGGGGGSDDDYRHYQDDAWYD